MEPAPAPGDQAVREDPDVWGLFRHYDQLYFRGALVHAAFIVDWASPRMKTVTSGFGSCSSGKTGKKITLYKPMLKDRPRADLKNALLHLMIHAIEFVKHGTSMTCLSRHGPVFRDWMDAINTCTIEDPLRPEGGYCITTTHDFSQEKDCSIQGNLWKCESCDVTLLRATRLGPPSDSCCIENVSQQATCGNMLCNWHNHKRDCGGTYVVPGRRGQKLVRKAEAQENSTVAKPYAEEKLLSQAGGRNARSPGGSSSKKAFKSYLTEIDYQKEIALHQRQLRETLVASAKHEKADQDFQKAIAPFASAPSKLKWKQTSVASLYSSFVGRRNANVLDNISSSKKARKQREHDEETRKPIARPAAAAAAPRSILKQLQNKTNSSVKAGKLQHGPEVTFLQPAVVSETKLKQSDPTAPRKKPRTGSKTDPSPARKKVYACVSVWAGIYESDCSSGSDEPLVNKRTERRKREREASIKAQAAAEEEISSQRMDIAAVPPADLAITRAHGDPSIPASTRVDIAAAPRADQVMTLAHVDQLQPPPAARAITTPHQVVQPHSADPPLLQINPSSSPDVIAISDDD